MRDKLNLIIKFLNREANISELENLEKSIKEETISKQFDQMVKIHYLLSLCMKNYDLNKAKTTFKKSIKKNARKKTFKLLKRVSVAAAILALVLMGQYAYDHYNQKPINALVKQEDNRVINRAILTLENGDQVVLQEGVNYNSKQAKGNGTSLVYRPKKSSKKLDFHYLEVPKGGKYEIQLSDGTVVLLNSESKLKYPTAFKNNRNRKVELLYGEIFLKVTSSKLNNGASFQVISKDQNIEVLGTKFNVRAYSNEELIKTTLVEGSVSVSGNGKEVLLFPNQQAVSSTNSKNIEVKSVDVSQEISWINGLFAFDSKSLETIMKNLARWYDVQVVFKSANLKEFVFTGILERSSSIEDVLKHIEATSEGKLKFTIENKTILIQENMD